MAKKKILKHGVPVRFGTYDTPPDNPENGMIYYDTAENFFKVYENSTWQILSSQNYANAQFTNLDVKQSCEVATTSNLSATYFNGSSGVGATLTGSSALPTIDGVTLTVGKRVLVHKQTSALQNGIYTVTQTTNPFILTRATDFNHSSKVNGGEFVFIKNGGELYKAGTFICMNTSSVTFGTTAITFTQTTGLTQTLQQQYSVGGQMTTTGGNNVVIAGSEKLQVEAAGGMEITNSLSAGATVVSTASVSGSANVGAGKLVIGSDGNITKLNNVTTSFPTSASQSNYALANNGSGTLSFTNLAISSLNDITQTSSSDKRYFKYSSTSSKWLDSFALGASTNSGEAFGGQLTSTVATTRGGIATNNISDTVSGSKIYFAGGYTNNSQNSNSPKVEIFDTATNTWLTALNHPYSQGQLRHASATLQDGRLIFIGGSQSFDLSFIYNPATNTWTQKSLPSGRGVGDAKAVTVGNKVYIGGGVLTFNSPYTKASNLLIFNSDTDTYSQSSTAPSYHGGSMWGVTCLHYNGKIYKGGGNASAGNDNTKIDVYDIAANTWQTINTYYTGSFYVGAAKFGITTSGKIVYFNSSNGPYDAYVYDINTNGPWVKYTNAFNQAWSNYYWNIENFEVYQNYVLVCGGFSSQSYFETFNPLVFNVDTGAVDGTFTVSNLSRRYAFTHVIGGKLYILGGFLNAVAGGLDTQILPVDVISLSLTRPIQDITQTNSSGYMDSSFLRTTLNLNNNIISGIQSPAVSTDLATKAYVDAISLQSLYHQDSDGSGASVVTDSADGAFIISGSEKIHVTASSGMTVSADILVGSVSAGSLTAGNSGFRVATAGNLARLAGLSYNFPTDQAAGDNYLIVNDGSGNLSWANFNLDQMSDAIVTAVSDFQVIRYDGTNFVNVNTVLSGGADQILRADVSGHLGTEALQYPIDFTGLMVTEVGMAVGSSDMVSKAYADANALDSGINAINLNSAYHYGPVLTTNSTDGILEIMGSESLKVSASFALADSSDDTKFSKVFYKHGITLAANMTSAILNDLTFSSALYQGCVIEYRMKDNVSGDSRVGTLMLSTDGASTSISDTFAETAPMGVTWAATMAENDVQVLYTTNTSAKTLSAKIKFFA